MSDHCIIWEPEHPKGGIATYEMIASGIVIVTHKFLLQASEIQGEVAP